MKYVKRIKAWALERIARALPWNLKLSYSQFGEDRILHWLNSSVPKGFYVDVGAYHPIALSNTYSLYCRGWRGINVEPRSEMIAEFNAYRPRDTSMALALGPSEGMAKFYVFEQTAYSTLDRDAADELQRNGLKLKEVRNVRVCTLAQLLDQYAGGVEVDFLNIDVEGLDDAVLRSNDWTRYRPRIIAVERHRLNLRNAHQDSTVAWIEELGYELVAKCGPTFIFVRCDDFRA